MTAAPSDADDVLIVGGGIGGLATARARAAGSGCWSGPANSS